jgi:acyl-CoA dehydrogenase
MNATMASRPASVVKGIGTTMPETEPLARYGTPAYHYDLAEVRRSARALFVALPEYATVFYSLKANPHPEVVAELRRAGCRAEVCSTGELTAALVAGHDPATVLYGGPGKTPAEISDALAHGVRHFSTESLPDLERVTTLARTAGADVQCLLRVNAATGGASSGIRMTGKPSQFGFAAEDAAIWAPRALEMAGAAVAGLHFFPVSNARSAESLLAEIENSLALAAELHHAHALPVRWLDLGGGFAAPYAQPGDRPDYTELHDRIDAAVRKSFTVTGDDRTHVAFECGRYLVATAGSLVTTVTDVKRSKGHTFVVLDTGINHLGGMSGLQRILPLAAQPLARTGEPADTPGDESVTLVGPLCAPSDVLARDARLGPTAPGDRLVIPNVGAYGASASLMAFLSREAAVEVVVDGDQEISATRPVIQRVPMEVPGNTAPGRTAPAPVELCTPLLPEIAGYAGKADAEAAFPTESLALLRESGLMGLLVPRAYGGLGAGLRELADVVLALAGACTSTAMIFAMHCQQTDAVVRFGSPALRARLLPRIAAGKIYLASITSERETGGHLLTSAAPLVEEGDQLLIDRDAPVVTGGGYADGFVITMRAGVDAPPHRVSLVYADRDQLEIATRGEWDPLGMRATESTGMHLRGLIGTEQLIGRPGHFRDVALESFSPVGHIGWSAVWLGTARHALEQLVRHLRSKAGKSSADMTSDLFAERLARARGNLEAVSAYLTRTIDEVEGIRATNGSIESPPVQIHLNTLKIMASELSFDAVDRVVQLAGLRLGYLKDSPLTLERAFRDLRSGALNYANDRLLRANGLLQLTDRDVRLI